jgi:hypothetical protein
MVEKAIYEIGRMRRPKKQSENGVNSRTVEGGIKKVGRGGGKE